jgi:hypothetical protein
MWSRHARYGQGKTGRGITIMDDNESLELEFRVFIEINNDKDQYENDYFTYLNSPITYRKCNDNSEVIENSEIGKMELIYLHGNRAYNNGLDIVDICDSESQALYDYASSIYRKGFISKKYCETQESNDVLILDRIEIEKSHQGKGLGLVISKKVIEIFGYNCGAILIKPFPLQFSVGRIDVEKWNNKFMSEKFSSDFEVCKKKLLKFWKRLSPHCVSVKSGDSETMLCIPQ